MPTLSVLDCIFCLICLYFAFNGMIAGFMKEFFSKAAVIAGIVCSVLLCNPLAARLLPAVRYQLLAQALAFVCIFIAVYIVVRLVQKALSAVMKGEILGSLDRILGFALGAAEGALAVLVIMFVMRLLPVDLSGLCRDSLFCAYISQLLPEGNA